MSNFVYDLTTLPSGKSDLVPIPVGADLTQYLPAAHWNTHVQASYDVRAALRTGVFQGLAEQASDPAPSDADAYWWLQNTGVMRLVGPTEFHFGGTITAAEPTLSTHLATRNYVDTHASISPLIAKGDLYTRTATIDARFPVGTAGQLLSVNLATTTGLEWIAPPTTVKTLQGAYTDGGAGPQVIDLSTSGKGIKIRDTLAGIGEALFAVQNSTGVTSHFAVNSDGTVAMAGALTVTGVVIGATPTLSTHLTTKGYVDGLITGLSWKAMVRLASTVAGGNVTLSGDQSIDGFTTTEGDRVLLKNQTSAIENGIWIAHTGAAWTRATDMPAGSHGATTTCFVDIGTANQDTSWFCSTEVPTDIVGTDPLAFQIFSNTISMHNSLTGLDGGTSGQYYHLTSAQHTALTNTFTVGMGGTGTSTQFTEGSIVFAGGSGVYSQNNAKLTWDNANFRLSVTGDLTITGALGLYSYTAGETLAQYDVVYAYCEGGTSGRLKKATNAAESTSRVVGVVVTGNTAGNAATVVMAGVYKMTFTGTAPAIADFGKPVYLSATAGAVTLTAPGAGTVLLRVGYLVGIGAQAEVSIHVGDEFQQ